MDLVSVIIPVYNAENTIGRCLISIQKQTYKNMEVILVDDGSDDKSEKIIKKLARNDKRIFYFRQENCGVSSARNRGISLAAGKYIIFCDSDDYVSAKYVEKLLAAREKFNSDWVIAGYIRKRVTKGTDLFSNPYSKQFILESHMEEFLNSWYVSSYIAEPWSKLYVASIIRENNIQFPLEMDYGEDTIFNIRYVSNCKTVSVVSEALYCYIENKESLTHKKRPDIWESQMKIFESFLNMSVCKGYKKETYQLFFARGIFVSLNYAVAANWPWKDWNNLCKKIKRNQYYQVCSDVGKQADKYSYFIFSCMDKDRILAMWFFYKIKSFIHKYFKGLHSFLKNLLSFSIHGLETLS